MELLDNEFEEYKKQTEEYKRHLQQELSAEEAELRTFNENNEKFRDQIETLKVEHSKSERENSMLRDRRGKSVTSLEELKKRKVELELVNDQWKQSTRILLQHNKDLNLQLKQSGNSFETIKVDFTEQIKGKTAEIETLKFRRTLLSQELTAMTTHRTSSLKSCRYRPKSVAMNKTTTTMTPSISKTHTSRSSSSVKVLTRIRPSRPSDSSQAASLQANTITIDSFKPRGRAPIQRKKFIFEKVLGPHCTTDDLFEEIQNDIESVVKGKNCCIIAYGQTGSGKTYTINGVIARALQLLSELLGPDAHIELSCVEIYNESIRDLLGPERLSKNWKETLAAARLRLCHNWVQEATNLIAIAKKSRSTKATESNTHSSRSHAVFSLTVNGSGIIRWVDLAGNERIAKSSPSGDVLRETLLINKSLSALQNVIVALDNKQAHVPYRNSMLTSVLSSTLGKDKCLVTVILNCSLATVNLPETVCTLALGTRLKSVNLSYNLRASSKECELQDTLLLLNKERTEKEGLIKRLGEYEKELQQYKDAARDRETQVSAIAAQIEIKQQEYKKEIAGLKQDFKPNGRDSVPLIAPKSSSVTVKIRFQPPKKPSCTRRALGSVRYRPNLLQV